jgi:alkylation response protein AidB-like acyl-CoA dehydrogenase
MLHWQAARRETDGFKQENMMAVESSELDALRESIAEVLAAECDSRKLHDFVDGKDNARELETRLWKQAAELGWLGVGISEANGGLGLGVEGLGTLHQELGRRLVPGPYIATLAAAQWIEAFGDDAAKKQLAPIAAGELSIAVPASISAINATSRLSAKGNAVSGSMKSLLGSPAARYALLPVADAWSLVELDGKASKLSARRPWDPTRALFDLECQGAKAVLSVKTPEAGWRLARELSLAVACDSVGAAETIYLQTVEYQKTRVQFERPLASFQALKHRAANLKIAHDTARHVAGQALAASEGPDADLWAGLAKASVTDAFVFIASDCLQLHGGVGYTWEFDCHLYVKRARLNQALVGTNESQTDTAFDAIVAAMKQGRSTLEISL